MPSCQITKDKLKEVMKFQLTHFNTTTSDVTDQTKHSDILNDDGYGNATSKNLYKSFIRYTIVRNSCENKKWPANWMELTVEELADKLL